MFNAYLIKAVSLSMLLILASCFDWSNDLDLPDVSDFTLASDAEVLADVERQLSGLGFDDFLDQSFIYVSNLDDEIAIGAGFADDLTNESVNLADVSDEKQRQVFKIWSKINEILASYDKEQLTSQQQLSFDIYRQFLQYQATAANYIEYSFPATYRIVGWPTKTESFFTQVFIIDSDHDAQIYLTLLNQIKRRFQQVEVLLDTRAKLRIIEPKFTLDTSRDNIVLFARQASQETSYYRHFEAQLKNIQGLASDVRSDYLRQAEAIIKQRVLPAYQSLGQTLNGLYPDAPDTIGFGQFPDGADYYQSRLTFFTSSDMTADDIHQLGLQQLTLIHQQMSDLFNELGYPDNESLQQSYNRVAQDAGIIKANQVKTTYENIISQAYSDSLAAFSTIPQQEVIVVGGETGGYYIRGTDDGTRPGAFYANTANDQPYTTMPTLAYHEAIPGHHFQIALASETNLPLIQRKYGFTAFVEGWALYAERLAKDLGWYANDPFGDLGRLQYEAMRAARLVIDTGIHVYGWSARQADNFHLANVGYSGSIARYSVWPGQATAYSAGMLKILALRQQTQSQLGELYDIKEFHKVILESGAMPLNILQQHVERYIAAKLNAAK